MRYSDISAKLANQAEAVCKELLPNGSIVGNKYCIGDVTGVPGKSLKINLYGNKIGKWYDFNGGEHGDLLDLWAASKNLELSDAYDEACDWLGIKQTVFPSKEKQYIEPKIIKFGTSNCLAKNYLINERGLSEEILNKYQVEFDNENIIFNFYRDGILVNRKTLSCKRDENGKKLPARFEKGAELCLFGWDAYTRKGKYVLLCEGEIDAMSMAQYGIPTMSVPNGASGTTWIENDYDRLQKFDKIYLCFDNDDAGQKGALEHAKRLGFERCYNIILPENDVNDCLLKNISSDEILNCFKNAKSFDPEQLQTPISFKQKLFDRLYPENLENLGFDSPWRKFNEKIFFDKSGLSVWTGVNGHGKTQFLNHLACHWMSKEAKVCIASLELDPDETMQNMLAVLSCKNTNPRLTNLISREYANKCVDWLDDNRLWFYDEFGGANAKELVATLEYAHRKYGIDIFIIDSLSLINIDDDDYNNQANFVRELVKFKKQNNCHVHLVVHPRKGADENQSPGKFDFKGSGTITNLADNCFSVTRNKQKELAVDLQEQGFSLDQDQIEKTKEADCYVWCMKQRKGGHEGKFGFWLDFTAKQYLAYESDRAIPYVEHSNQK